MHSSDTKTPSLMRVATRWLAAVHNTRLLHLNVKPLIKFRQRGNPIEADHCGDVDGKHICGDDFEFYEALVDSIRRHGVKEPVHLTAWGGKPHLADGHHRLNAAWEAGTKTIPAEVDSRLTDDWLLQQGLIDKRTASVSLGDRMFAIDNQLSPEAANWNHNLAHALKTMDRLSARPEKLTRFMKTFDAAFWLNRNPKALAEIKTLDPRLVRDIVEFLQRGHRTAARPIRLDPRGVKKALDAFQSFVQRGAQNNGPDETVDYYTHDLDIPLLTVMGETRQVVVEYDLRPNRSDKVTLGGSFNILDDLKDYDDNPLPNAFSVTIFINGSLTWRQLAEPNSIKAVRRILMHELTHAADKFKATYSIPQSNSSVSPTQMDLDAYYNAPTEVRAHMRELYEAIAPTVRNQMDNPRARLGQIITNALQRVPEARDKWTAMTPHLSRQNKNRILKGLVTAFEDEGARPRTAARPIKLDTQDIKVLARQLTRQLRSRGLPKPNRVVAEEWMTVTNVKGDEVDVEISLVGSPKVDFDKTDLIQGAYLKRGYPNKMVVFLNAFMPPRTFESWPTRMIEKELYRILTHELTHAADLWSGKGSVGDLSKSKDELLRHHHNHPAEVKALMRDVATGVEDTVQEFIGVGMTFQQALTYALEDSKWADIKDYLTPKNHKTILKGVYTHLQDLGLTEPRGSRRH